jgi:WD40 repeat protein
MTQPSIFISYARADDELFVERLYHDLTNEFDVWWDRVSMPNRGLTFLQEIREAIDRADRLLLVAGPSAFASDYVRDEWQYAYQTGKAINIVLRLGDYADLPPELQTYDAPDFRDDADYAARLHTLKRQMTESVAPMGQFHNVPALPPHFLQRPDALDALRDLIIADVDTPTLITAEKRVTAVEGMGGIGKSVLATAFAHDRKVRFAFPDGIVWVTAGRTPSLFELYRAVGIALGDELGNYPDESTARQNAQHMLQGKKCLIILDDVWELLVGRAFRDLIHGTPARLLITTRNLQINDVLNANEYRLDLIDENQAADYLHSWVGRDDPDLATVAEKLGYLFLALKLAGARMKKDGLSGTEYLRIFNRVSRMKIARGAADREDSLEASITLSVDAAFVGVEDEKLLYHTFGIFQEDAAIPQQTILQLWRHLRPDVDEFDLRETLAALVDLALVERDRDNGTITLHDLLHSYTREKLGDRAMQTHQALLDSYGVEQWHDLPPDEPYLWWHIAYHLLAVGRAETLQALMLDFDFLRNKLTVTDPNALTADCALLPDDSVMRIMHSFWQVSAHVFAVPENLDQLHNQLIGRLGLHQEKHADIRMLLDATRAVAEQHPDPVLILVKPTLNPAGGMLERILKGHTGSVNGSVELSEGRILSWGGNKIQLWSLEGIPLAELENTGTITLVLDDKRLLSRSRGGALQLCVVDGETLAVLAMLTGHTNRVNGAMELSDRRLLSWSQDGTLRLWATDGKPLAVLVGHTNGIDGAAELNDGRLLSWSQDYTLRLWSAAGETLAVLNEHRSFLNGVAKLSDGRILSWSRDKTLRLWNTDGHPLAVMAGHTNGVYGAMELSDGRILSWSFDGTLRLWNTDGHSLAVMAGHTDFVSSATELSDGRILSRSEDGTLRLWSAYGDLLAVLEGHSGGVSSTLVLDDGRLLSWSGKTLRLWSADGDPLAVLEGHSTSVNGALELRDGRILSWSHDGTLRLWSKGGTPLAALEGHSSNVNGAAELSDGRILSWSHDGTLRLWNTNDDPLPLLEGHPGFMRGMLTLDDKRILSWSDDGTLRLWSTNGDLLTVLEGHKRLLGALVLADGHILSWSVDGTLRLWGADGAPLAVLKGHTRPVVGAVALDDGRLLSWSLDNTLRVWRGDGAPLAVLEGHPYDVRGTLVLNDGRLLSWSARTLRLWSTDGDLLAVLEGHSTSVNGALELRDGRLLSWSQDNTLRLWNADGVPLVTLTGHTGGVTGVLETRDGRFLSWTDSGRFFNQSEDHTLRLWSCDGAPLVTLTGHTGKVIGALETRDGRFLSWDSDDDYRLWDADGMPLWAVEDPAERRRLRYEGRQAAEELPPVIWESEDITLVGFSRDSGAAVCDFISDARLRMVAQLPDGTVVTGGDGGVLHFLRPNAALRRLMVGEE